MQTILCSFSEIIERTPKSLPNELNQLGLIKDMRVTFDNTSLTVTTVGGQEFIQNISLPIEAVYPLEDGIIVKCRFKQSHHSHFEENVSHSLTKEFCYVTLTGHPLNDINPLSLDQVQQLKTRAEIVYVGGNIPFAVVQEGEVVKFCLICRQNSALSFIQQVKPESRNRLVPTISDSSKLNLSTVFKFTSKLEIIKVVLTQSLIQNTFIVSVLNKGGRMSTYVGDLNLNFKQSFTMENIVTLSEINFIVLNDEIQLYNTELLICYENRFEPEINYFKNCIKNLPRQIAVVEQTSGQLQVYLESALIHQVQLAKATGIMSLPQFLYTNQLNQVILVYENGRVDTLLLSLRIDCKYVSAIISSFEKILPLLDYLQFISRVVKLFTKENGELIKVFVDNFYALVGIKADKSQTSPQKNKLYQPVRQSLGFSGETKNQANATNLVSPFQRMLQSRQHEFSTQNVRLNEDQARLVQDLVQVLLLLLEELKLKRVESQSYQLLELLVAKLNGDLQAKFTDKFSQQKPNLIEWCQTMKFSYPILFEKSRILVRLYEVISQRGKNSHFCLPTQQQDPVIINNLFNQYQNLNFVQQDQLPFHPQYSTIEQYLMVDSNQNRHIFEKVLEVLTQEQFGNEQISQLPYQIQLPIHEIISYTRSHIDEIKTHEWPASYYRLIRREDILNNMKSYQSGKPLDLKSLEKQLSSNFGIQKQLSFKHEFKKAQELISSETFVEDLIGMQGLAENKQTIDTAGPTTVGLNATFKDSRFKEVEYLLRSDIQMKVKTSTQSDLTEDEILNAQKGLLEKMFKRQLSKCVGRGAVLLGTQETLPTEKLDIPPITTTAIVQRSQLMIDDTEVPQPTTTIAVELKTKEEKEMMQWSEFHNGVSSALKISSQSFSQGPNKNSRNWIMQYRPILPKNEHGGFLLGLGLMGQLDSLQPTDLYQHLKSAHDCTTIGILLGRAASKIGKMDDADSRMMCLHIPALLPHTLTVDYSLSVQSAAVIGSGLLYMATGNRQISEMLLSQIAKKPNTDKLVEREGYSFAAGLALGLVNLQSLKSASDHQQKTQLLQELQLEERLVRFVEGGKSLPLPRSMLSQIQLNENAKSSAIKETDQVNTSITALGALTAIALIYLKSNNTQIAKRIQIPQTFNALDNITPQTLVFKVIAKNLILWDQIQNTQSWVSAQIPNIIRTIYECNNQQTLNKELRYKIDQKEVDFAQIAQSYVNIKAASILSMGFKYAGTCDKVAKQTLLEEISWFRKKIHVVPAVQQIGGLIQPNTNFTTKNQVDRNTVEKCLSMCALSLGMIMSGSCDVDSFKILRVLRKRFEIEMHYGHNQALNLAIGMIFLAQGQFTFSRSAKAIAGLFCSVFPVFASAPGDNRFYLQALRHFYMFALETRLLQACDIDTGNYVKVSVQVEVQNSEGKSEYNYISTPEIINGQIMQISLKGDPNYHDLSLQVTGDIMNIDQQNQEANGEFKKSDLKQVIYVKRKNFFSKIQKNKPVDESLQQLLQNDFENSDLDAYALQAYECLKNISDPSIQSFQMTFATEFDSQQTLTNIMVNGHIDYFNTLDLVASKISKFKQSWVKLNLVQLYECYINDRMSSLPILLQNAKHKLKSSSLTAEPLIETRQSAFGIEDQNTNIHEQTSQEKLAIAILDELIGIGEREIVKSFLDAVKSNAELTGHFMEVHQALKMCGLDDQQIKSLAYKL